MTVSQSFLQWRDLLQGRPLILETAGLALPLCLSGLQHVRPGPKVWGSLGTGRLVLWFLPTARSCLWIPSFRESRAVGTKPVPEGGAGTQATECSPQLWSSGDSLEFPSMDLVWLLLGVFCGHQDMRAGGWGSWTTKALVQRSDTEGTQKSEKQAGASPFTLLLS